MPSHKPMKTYLKKTRVRMNTGSNSVDAVNALFVENLTKRFKSRKKAKIKLKELPPRTQNQLTDDSLEVETNNTFDKILKGKVYNKVKVVCNLVQINSTNSDSSKHVSVSYHSPMMTRRRKKTSVVIAEVSDTTKSSEKSSTLDKPVTKSLSIEKENKQNNFSSLSYIKLPRITEDEGMNNNIGPIFSDTFRERASVHSSTPYLKSHTSKIVADPISPIAVNTRSSTIIADAISPIAKSDSSSSSGLIRKSFDLISKWEESFPLEETPQPIPARRRGRPRKLSSVNTVKYKDWKLNCEVKVWLENCLKKPKSKSRKSSDAYDDFIGFDCEEQNSFSKLSDEFSKYVLEYTRRKIPLTRKKSDADLMDLKGFTEEEKSSASEYSNECHNSFVSYNFEYTKRKQRLPSLKTKPQKDIATKNKKSSISRHSNVTNRRKTRKEIIKTGTKKRRKTRSSGKNDKIDFKQKSVKKKRSKTGTPRSRRSFVTLRRLPDAAVVTKSQAANSRKSKVKKSLCVDVTDDILSEKEMSYSHSTLFDFSPSSSKVQIEELKDKEVTLPKKNDLITVDLNEFNKFMQSYYIEQDKETSVSVISVSDDDTCDFTKSEVKPITIKTENDSFERNSNSSNNNSLDFLIPPRRSNSNNSNKSGTSKIVILSDITLGFNNKPLTDLNKSLDDICHDHSYSNTPPRALPSSPQYESPKKLKCSILEPQVDLSDIIESSTIEEHQNNTFQQQKLKKSLKLKPGKLYRRSLSLLRRSSVLVDITVVCPEDCVCFKCMFKEKLNLNTSRKSQIVPASAVRKSLRRSLLECYATHSLSYVQEQEEDNLVDDLDGSVQNLRNLSLNARKSIVERDLFEVTAKEVVLRRCGQLEVLGFEECFPTSALQNCHKIGEGVYGEVFLYRNADGGTSVMKIIPIEGDLIVNGERQKKFKEILSEIVIAMELSNLRNNKKNSTTCFSEVQKVRCTQGNYPDRLVDLWQLYDETKGSENDSPQMFPSDQMYIVLELANGGRDLESFVFNNAMQAYAMFQQTACALAVAESELNFEHRDLHWGNVLLTTVDKNKTLRFRLDGKEIEIETSGVEVAIIDFTLSRIEFDGVIIFNDLSLDSDLFVAKGDYQFEIYRLMQKSSGNEWQHFEPYTNLLWLHYILDKVTEFRYKNVKSKIHKNYLTSLNKLKQEVLSYNSVTDFVKEKFF